MYDMYELVKTLTELPGPTGYEKPVQDWIARRWQEIGLEVQRSTLGNVMARLGGQGPKLLIGAHADEISYRVKSVDLRGFLWLTTGRPFAEQRPPESIPLGHVARVITPERTVNGTFVTVTGHVMTRQQRIHFETHELDWMDFFVDIGARSREAVEAMGIYPGAHVIADVPTRRVGQNIVGKAMDDRAGLAVMTAMVDRLDRHQMRYEVWFASTVMEELGLTGARTAVAGFDQAIVVEVGLAGDIPLVDERQMPVGLGRGPVVVHKDMGIHYSMDICTDLARCAQAKRVPVQHATFPNFSSDGSEWMKEGIPTGMIAFPCRYTHSTHETVRESDLKQMADLLAAFVTQWAT